jgi:hypothetical protein
MKNWGSIAVAATLASACARDAADSSPCKKSIDNCDWELSRHGIQQRMWCKTDGDVGWCYETLPLCMQETDGPCVRNEGVFCFVSDDERFGRACFTSEKQCRTIGRVDCFSPLIRYPVLPDEPRRSVAI